MAWTLEQLRRRGGVALTILVALAVLIGAGAIVAWRVFGPERFEENLELGADPQQTAALPQDPEAPLALSPSTEVYLVFSVGSKGLTDDEARDLRINDLGSRGADGLTDTVMLLFVDEPTRRAAMLSIPRDTWLFHRDHRVNATLNLHGLQAFVDDVAQLVGVPIHHVVEVNFAGFAQLVDDIGGVALSVPKPLADVHSVLYVPRAGCWRFDGAAALAYVRSRHTLTQRSGSWVVDNSASDVGRIGRQREVLAAAWQQLRGPGLITKIPSLLSAARQGLTLDEDLGVRSLADLARTFADIGPSGIEAYTLPTTGQRIGRAAAQVVVERAAKPILKRLRAWPPDRDLATEGQAEPTSQPTTEPPAQPTAPSSPSPTTAPTASPPSQPTPAPSPVPDPEIETLGQPAEDCTLETALELPDPAGPLTTIYRDRGGEQGIDRTEQEAGEDGGGDGEPETEPSPDDGTDGASPGPDDGTTEQPSEEPTDEPTEEPSPEPSPSLTVPPLPG